MLTTIRENRYYAPAPEFGAGFDSPMHMADKPPAELSGFFTSAHMVSHMSEPCGKPQGLPAPYARSVNPHGSLALLTEGGRVNKLAYGEMPCLQQHLSKKTPYPSKHPTCTKSSTSFGRSALSGGLSLKATNTPNLEVSSASLPVSYQTWLMRCNTNRPRSGGIASVATPPKRGGDPNI